MQEETNLALFDDAASSSCESEDVVPDSQLLDDSDSTVSVCADGASTSES